MRRGNEVAQRDRSGRAIMACPITVCPTCLLLPLPQAAALSVPNAYGALLQQEGGVGLNAATSHDATK